MIEEIKGIMHLDVESRLFEDKVKTGKEESVGIMMSMDWELDKINLFLTDKEDNPIANLVFDNSDFQSIANKCMPPPFDDLEDEPTEEEQKQFEKDAKEDVEYMKKNPTKKEIEGYHK